MDFSTFTPEMFIAFGSGCVTAYAFAMRTAVQTAKDQLTRERQMFEERLLKQEKRFIDQLAQAQSHLDDYKEQLRICQEGHK